MRRLKTRPRGLLALLLLAASSVALPAVSPAESWDPFPDLRQGRRLALAPSVDPGPFRGTEACLARGSKSGASYYAAVVRITDPEGRTSARYSNAVPYVDALYAQWRNRRLLDPASHVLIVVSMENRGIAIHPGTRWADLGFEGRAITEAIDNSRFGGLARSGEMGQALCALAEDLDVTLGNMLRRERMRAEELAGGLRKLAAARKELRRQAEAWAEMSPEATEDWLRRLGALEDDSAAAARALDRGRLSVAVDGSRSVAREQSDLEAELALARSAQEALETLRPDLEKRHRRLADLPRSDAFDRSRRLLVTCEALADGLEASLLSGEIVSPKDAESCVEAYDRAVADARTMHTFRTVVLPAVVFGGLLLLAAMLLGLHVLRLRRAKRRGRELVDAWGTRLDRMADQLLDVETQHPLYFTPDLGRWTGESRELDRRAAEAVNRVYLLYSEAHLLLGQARNALAGIGFSDFRDLDRVETLLRDTPIAPGAEGDGTKLRLPGAPPPEITCTAAELLEEIDRRYLGLTEHLTEVTRVAERFWELVRESDVASGEASEACARRAELESPVESLSEELEPILDRRREAMERSDDPVAANPALEAVVADLRRVRDRALSGNLTLEALRGPVAETARGLVARLEEMRGQGFTLEEPGFAPDLRLERGRREADRIEQTVADGREDEGARLLDALRHGLGELGGQLDTVRETRDTLPARLEDLERDVKALEARIPAGRAVLDQLRGQHAPGAFTEESDNLEELEKLLADFARWSEELRRDYDLGHFLAASEDLKAGDELIAHGTALLDGLDAIIASLEESRERALESAASAARVEERLEALVEQTGIDRGLESAIREALDASRRLRGSTEEERPHWPDLEDALAAHRVVLDARVAEAEQQTADFEKAEQLAQALAERGDALAREAAREHRDRPFVEEAVETARRELETWRVELAATRPGDEIGGSVRLQQSDQLRGRLDWAEDVWRSEMNLVRLAESKLQAAEHRVGQVDGRDFGYGVVGSCGLARDTLRRAHGLRGEQQWEQVLELAGRAVASAEEESRRRRQEAAHREAEERRRREQIRRAEERREARRRREMAAVAARAAASAVSSWSSSRTSSSSFGRSSGFGGRSGGSSFGGSRSGGSSW